MRCPSCAEEISGSKFCPECGAALTVEPPARGRERKVVSVLFCDLVGFTAASESADPEDVQARLVPYHALLRERIGSFGGTVEKFVGDAVMAVFGAPIAHEDDAERAVRAGLAILSAIEELNTSAESDLSVRVGINTGEVVVALGAHPELGEGYVTGDAVNTAARIQSAAPVGGVAVGESTYAATSRVFAYEPLDAVSVKGKSEPVALWRAGPPRARFGADVIRSTDAALVGRELELLQLRGVFDRVARDGAVHLVTITGVPGVGKSRLVAELATYVDGLTDLVTWRTGRCLPYGDGITFWALGEIVKSHAGILDTDNIEAATSKLDAVLPADEDRPWLRARLLPLIGITTDAGGSGGSSVSQEESFTAWRRFVESFATTGPAVLVIEDIHWADPALLQFLRHLTAWIHELPLLVVCTARPELFDTHLGWGTGLRNTLTLNVSPLSEQETAAVVTQLLGLPVIPAATQQLILARAEGNPLWVEECVRVLRDRDLIDARGQLRSGEVPLPHGIQALITARLDTLPDHHKALLADAAVVGRVFWADALVALGEREPDQVTAVLHELTSKEFIRPHRESTFAGHAEFEFWHALVRDVAYQALPRSARAAKHVAASRWLADQAGDRVADVAEILADHTSHALELAQASGDASLAEEVAPAARRYALLAADKALALDSARAIALLDRALSLTGPQDSDYPDVLVLWARAAIQVGRPREGVAAFRRAANHYQQRNDVLLAGSALRQAGEQLFNIGDPDGQPVLDQALRLLESQPPSAELGLALVDSAIIQLDAGTVEKALSTVKRMESLMAEDNAQLVAWSHMIRGMVRMHVGDAEGVADIERSIEVLIDADLALVAATAYTNLVDSTMKVLGPEVALTQVASGLAYCQARGLTAPAWWLRGFRVKCLIQVGQLRDALALADTLLPYFEQADDDRFFADICAHKALILLEINGSAGHAAEEGLNAVRRTGEFQLLGFVLTTAALGRCAAARRPQAHELLGDLQERTGIERTDWARVVHKAVRCAVAVGDIELARDFVSRVEATLFPSPACQHSLVTARAVLAHADRHYSAAVELFTEAVHRWEQFESRLEHADALVGLAESFRAMGQEDAGRERLQEALGLFAAMGADYRVRQCRDLLEPGAETGPRTGAGVSIEPGLNPRVGMRRGDVAP